MYVNIIVLSLFLSPSRRNKEKKKEKKQYNTWQFVIYLKNERVRKVYGFG